MKNEANTDTVASRFLPADGLPGPDADAVAAAEARWAQLAKPVGSLGRLETVITKIAGISADPVVRLKPRRLLVACADNGIVRRGVAGTPPEITAVMAGMIADGRSAVARMAALAACDVSVHDIGMCRRAASNRVIDAHIADGTHDFSERPAMSPEQAAAAVRYGMKLAREAKADGMRLLLTGEMGIGNTTTAAAVAAALTGQDAAVMTGRGAGLDDASLARKLDVVRQAIARYNLYEADPLTVLASVGGYDIALLAGAFIGGAAVRLPVLVDGVISSVAALVAERLCPGASYAFIASHVSAEPAGPIVLAALGLTPLLHGGMRLGEGTGAVALLPILDMAADLYHNLITFADIGMVP